MTVRYGREVARQRHADEEGRAVNPSLRLIDERVEPLCFNTGTYLWYNRSS